MQGAQVYCVVVYPNSRNTEIRLHLSLRSTHPNAYDRLDMHSIFSYDKEMQTSSSLVPGE